MPRSPSRTDIDQEIVVRLHDEGLGIRDIAEQLGCSPGTVKRRLGNAGSRPHPVGKPRTGESVVYASADVGTEPWHILVDPDGNETRCGKHDNWVLLGPQTVEPTSGPICQPCVGEPKVDEVDEGS